MKKNGIGLLGGQMLGGLLSAIPSIAGGINQLVQSGKQKKRAEEIEQEAKRVRPRALQDEFLKAQTEKELLAQSGMPTYGAAKEGAESSAANALRAIKESGAFGGTTAAAISAVLNQSNKGLMDLEAQQGQFKLANRQAAVSGLEGIGAQKEALTQEALEEKRRLRAAAESLLQASTANKQTGIETIGGSLTPLAKYIGIGAAGGFKDDNYATASLAGGGTTQSATGSMASIIAALKGKGMSDTDILEILTK